MDNVTHALAGCLLAAATISLVERRTTAPSRGLRVAATLIGVTAAELPDADLVYAGPALDMGKLGYLLHHRGHTHTVLFAIAGALLVWGLAMAFRPALRERGMRGPLLALALLGTLSHIALDFTNSYGVHPFWPVVNRWFYGDAVFIVEPWLWIASLPALLLFSRSTPARVLFGFALAAILVAAWTVSMVGRDVALALVLAAVLWGMATRIAPERRRLTMAFVAWIVVEAGFFSAAAAARGTVRRAAGASLRDVVLTPAVSNPFCFRALVVETDGPTYRVSVATVAPFPSVRDVGGCAGQGDNGRTTLPSVHPSTRAIAWAGEWRAATRELVALASSNCEIAAALQFIRVPVWTRTRDRIEFADLRYGEGRGGFASITTVERPTRCPAHVPGWTPPRSDVLGGDPGRGDTLSFARAVGPAR